MRRKNAVVSTTTCNAKTKSGTLCRQPSGSRTDHPGQGRCYLHGGATPIRSGRYSSVVRASLADHLERLDQETEAEKLNILPEATLIRALAAGFIERYDTMVEALLAWNKAEVDEHGPFARPQRIPELREVAELLDRAAVVVDRIHKQRAANAISRLDFIRVHQEMARVVERHVADPATLDKIKDGWLAIQVA